jgi:uncharacterized membrane protein YagU involved in acid resistance
MLPRRVIMRRAGEIIMDRIGTRIWASLIGGLLVGTLDIGVACAIFHVPPVPVLHAIASGLIGHDASVHGGMQTAMLGLALQEFISVVAAGAYVFAAAWLPVLLRRPIVMGLAFGAAVNFFLNFVVIPLSLTRGSPPLTLFFLENLIANMVLFGMPIALVAKWLLER